MTLSRYDCPAVEILVSPEGEIESGGVARGWHVDTSDAVEDAVNFGVLPKLVDRDQRVREERHTANVANEAPRPHPVAIPDEDW